MTNANREIKLKKGREYSNKYRKNNKEAIEKYSLIYNNTENGFLHGLWASIRIRCKRFKRINEFKNFDEFNNHWLEQKAKYGMKCPATGIEMTTIRKRDTINAKRCLTNISADRILSTEGYTRKNLIFTSWEFNSAKGSFTPQMARTFLKIVEERYGDKV